MQSSFTYGRSQATTLERESTKPAKSRGCEGKPVIAFMDGPNTCASQFGSTFVSGRARAPSWSSWGRRTGSMRPATSLYNVLVQDVKKEGTVSSATTVRALRTAKKNEAWRPRVVATSYVGTSQNNDGPRCNLKLSTPHRKGNRLGKSAKQHNDTQLNFSKQVINSHLLASNNGTKNIYRSVQAVNDKKLADDNVEDLKIASSPAVEEETSSRVSSLRSRTPEVSQHFEGTPTTNSQRSLQRREMMSSPEVGYQHRSFSERIWNREILQSHCIPSSPTVAQHNLLRRRAERNMGASKMAVQWPFFWTEQNTVIKEVFMNRTKEIVNKIPSRKTAQGKKMSRRAQRLQPQVRITSTCQQGDVIVSDSKDKLCHVQRDSLQAKLMYVSTVVCRDRAIINKELSKAKPEDYTNPFKVIKPRLQASVHPEEAFYVQILRMSKDTRR
ncbi:unnamed protein product [Caenorhabditis nigoni]